MNSSQEKFLSYLELENIGLRSTKTTNFVHTIQHSSSVFLNVLRIAPTTEVGSDDITALRLAACWHDAGQDDLAPDTRHAHEETGIQLFLNAAAAFDISSSLKKQVSEIIRNHRNRGAVRALRDQEMAAKVLWDADKLDIFNYIRCETIWNAYEGGISSEEFSKAESLKFWRSFDVHFGDRFHFEKSKELFALHFQDFLTWRDSKPGSMQ